MNVRNWGARERERPEELPVSGSPDNSVSDSVSVPRLDWTQPIRWM